MGQRTPFIKNDPDMHPWCTCLPSRVQGSAGSGKQILGAQELTEVGSLQPQGQLFGFAISSHSLSLQHFTHSRCNQTSAVWVDMIHACKSQHRGTPATTSVSRQRQRPSKLQAVVQSNETRLSKGRMPICSSCLVCLAVTCT